MLGTFAMFVDLFKNSLEDSVDNIKKGKSTSYSSASKASSNLIAVFPVLCSSNLKLESATLITKHVERKSCIDLQLYMAATTLTNVENGFDYIKKFHQNIDGIGSSGLEDFITQLQTESELNLSYKDMINLKEAMNVIMNGEVLNENDIINKSSLMDYFHSSLDGKYDINIHKEASYSTTSSNVKLLDSDVKKINSATPSIISVRFRSTTNDNEIVEFIMGIKSKVIPVDFLEILEKISRQNKDGKGLANLIRLTSGELSFVKDYLLALDDQKKDILKRRNFNSKEDLWRKLSSRAAAASIAVKTGTHNMASAITTVVISKEDADYLYKEESVNILNPTEALKFMKAYNLRSFIIVDEPNEYAMILEDANENVYEKVAFTMLERETQGDYKKMINLLKKM